MYVSSKPVHRTQPGIFVMISITDCHRNARSLQSQQSKPVQHAESSYWSGCTHSEGCTNHVFPWQANRNSQSLSDRCWLSSWLPAVDVKLCQRFWCWETKTVRQTSVSSQAWCYARLQERNQDWIRCKISKRLCVRNFYALYNYPSSEQWCPRIYFVEYTNTLLNW